MRLIVSQHPKVFFVEPHFHAEHAGLISLGCRARSVREEFDPLEAAGTPIIVCLSPLEHGVAHAGRDIIADDRNNSGAPRGFVFPSHRLALRADRLTAGFGAVAGWTWL